MRFFHLLLIGLSLLLASGCDTLHPVDDAITDEPEEGSQGGENYDGESIGVAQALQLGEGTLVSVEGYIVGYINGTAMSRAVFGELPTSVNTNMLIADLPSEDNPSNCLPVRLEAGEKRGALNLFDNPENLGCRVRILGELESYFRVVGIKSVQDYEFLDDEEGQEGEEGGQDEPDRPASDGYVKFILRRDEPGKVIVGR